MRIGARSTLEALILAAVAGGARLLAGQTGTLPVLTVLLDGRRNDIYPAIVGLTGSLLGFSIASFTIVIGYTGNPRLEIVRRSEQWRSLFTSFTASIRWTAYSTALSLLATIFDTEQSANFGLQVALAIAIGVAAVMIGRMIWVLHALLAIIAHPGNRSPGQ